MVTRRVQVRFYPTIDIILATYILFRIEKNVDVKMLSDYTKKKKTAYGTQHGIPQSGLNHEPLAWKSRTIPLHHQTRSISKN